MAFIRDTPLNPTTGRHELHFVNQQSDYLFAIRWVDARADYATDVSAEEARAIALEWGGGAWFNFEESLAWARKELPLLDGRPTAGTRR